MPRKPIGETAMTGSRCNVVASAAARRSGATPRGAERQARYRAAHGADAPPTRTHRPADQRGRARRWHDAVAELAGLQAQYAVWLEALPANLRDSALAEALQEICDFDLAELQAIEPPRGFGRD